MLEADFERKLANFVRALGGWAIKMDPSQAVGIPDRLLIFPGGVTMFVELKRTDGKGKLHGKQPHWAKRLTTMGHIYILADDLKAVKTAVRENLQIAGIQQLG